MKKNYFYKRYEDMFKNYKESIKNSDLKTKPFITARTIKEQLRDIANQNARLWNEALNKCQKM